MARATVRIVFYAVNGIGLGHLTRLKAIADELWALVPALGGSPDFYFITTSDASDVAGRYPVFKLPSKTSIRASGNHREAYVASAKMMVSNILSHLRPDILVMDTIPEGSFHEFLFIRDFARKTVFINRQRNRERAVSKSQQLHMGLYDLILIPDDATAAPDYPMNPGLKNRCCFTGRIHGFKPELAWHRDQVRAYFGVGDSQMLIYVSSGGGGDPQAEQEIERLLVALADDPQNFILAGYGPLYRGRKLYRPNLVPMVDPEVSRFFPGLDAAVSAAGYNTYEELLAAGVPSLFYAQAKGIDVQAERTANGKAAGLHGELSGFDPLLVQCKLAELLHGDSGADFRINLARRGVPIGALTAAVEILTVHESLTGSPINRRRLQFVAAIRRAWLRDSRLGCFEQRIGFALLWMDLKWEQSQAEDLMDRLRMDWNRPEPFDLPESASALLQWGDQLGCFAEQLDWNLKTTRRFLHRFGEPSDAPGLLARQLKQILESLLQSIPSDRVSSLLQETAMNSARDRLPSILMELAESREQMAEPEASRKGRTGGIPGDIQSSDSEPKQRSS